MIVVKLPGWVTGEIPMGPEGYFLFGWEGEWEEEDELQV